MFEKKCRHCYASLSVATCFPSVHLQFVCVFLLLLLAIVVPRVKKSIRNEPQRQTNHYYVRMGAVVASLETRSLLNPNDAGLSG